MKYTTHEYPFFPEKWPYTDMHYRLTFQENIYQHGPEFDDQPFISDSMHKGRLTDLLAMYLSLWDIKLDHKGAWLILYCNSINWLALAKLVHGDDVRSPMQSLIKIESWYNRSDPLPK